MLLRDGGSYRLAVLPASHHLRLTDLKTELGQDIGLAGELEVADVFRDCDPGAVPPVGPCYGLDVIIDTSIDQQPEVYFEGGDHTTHGAHGWSGVCPAEPAGSAWIVQHPRLSAGGSTGQARRTVVTYPDRSLHTRGGQS